MSLSKLRTAAALTALLAGSAQVWAQGEGQDDRFFSDKVDPAEAEGEKPTETLVQGSLTSTTFAFREFGGDPQEPVLQAGGLISNYSPAMRLFTDLRTQLDARHISGSTWDMRMDARLRMSLPCTFQTLENNGNAQLYNGCRTQSGTFGGNEYDARELYVRRAGKGSDLYIGRQFVHELAATRIDGIKLTYHKSDKWDYLGFGGLHPARGSRSVVTDYPTQVLADGQEGGPILPIAAGLGAAYRYRSIYGSLGGVGILPMAEDRYENQNEPPRIFVTESGYWQSSPKLDVYHFVVVDAQSAAGAGLTNLSLGLNIRPVPAMRVTAAVNHVDTETLNVIAQTYLADPEVAATAQPRNDVEVSRISAQSARLGVSVALAQQRFEVSTTGQVRQRPEIQLKQADDPANYIVIPAARAAEVTLQAVDRRSLLGLRAGVSLSRIFGLGNQVYSRSTAWIARLDGARDFKQGKGQVEANVSFVASQDEDRLLVCAAGQELVEHCFGTSLVQTVSLGSTLFYRFKTDWFVIASASAGRQGFSNYYDLALYQQPPNWLVTGFARLAYRF
jgi:hypothetical protein